MGCGCKKNKPSFLLKTDGPKKVISDTAKQAIMREAKMREAKVYQIRKVFV